MPWSNPKGWNTRGWNRAASAAGGSSPVVLANATTGAIGTSNTYSSLASVSAAAGAIVMVAMLVQGVNTNTFKDSVDSATNWTLLTSGGPSTMSMAIFQRIVPAGGFNSSTTFTATFSGSPSSTAMIVAVFPGATTAPTANNGFHDDTGTSPLTTVVTGPTNATSWQFAAVGTNWTSGSPGPDAGSDASWNALANNSNVNLWGILAFWRQASSTASTNLVTHYGGTGGLWTSAQWVEAKP